MVIDTSRDNKVILYYKEITNIFILYTNDGDPYVPNIISDKHNEISIMFTTK